MKPRVTAILLYYQRHDNMPRIVQALQEQSEAVDIWMIVNNSTWQSWGADRAVHIPWNAGVSIRVLMAVYAETPWVMFLDDDLVPDDTEFVKDALRLAVKRPDVILGAYGRYLSPTPPHYHCDADGRVRIVKGRFMFFHRDLLDNVRLPCVPPELDVRFCEDIHLSLEVGRGEPVHWVDAGLRERLRELPDAGGLCHRPGHMAERERFCEWWLEGRQCHRQ